MPASAASATPPAKTMRYSRRMSTPRPRTMSRLLAPARIIMPSRVRLTTAYSASATTRHAADDKKQQQDVLDGVEALDEEGGRVHRRLSEPGWTWRGASPRSVPAVQSLQPRAGSARALTAIERNSLLLPLTSRR